MPTIESSVPFPGRRHLPSMRTCRVCGCTEADCRRCIERTGHRCWWTGPDLCSACTPTVQPDYLEVCRRFVETLGVQTAIRYSDSKSSLFPSLENEMDHGFVIDAWHAVRRQRAAGSISISNCKRAAIALDLLYETF